MNFDDFDKGFDYCEDRPFCAGEDCPDPTREPFTEFEGEFYCLPCFRVLIESIGD